MKKVTTRLWALAIMGAALITLQSQSERSSSMDGVEFTPPDRVLSLYQLMKDVHELFELNGIEYWIDSGTLLGAVRHKGIIPWDVDLDLCISHRDEAQLLRLQPQLKKLGFKLLSRTFGWAIKAKGVLCDIFLTHQRNGRYMYHDKSTQTFFAKRDGGPIHYLEDELFPLKKYQFGELLVWGPQNPYPYLDNYYKGWQEKARFLINHATYTYSSKKVTLTDIDKTPAQPTGPLQDRVAEQIMAMT